MYIYLNGSIVRANEATISPFDHGFMYGLGLFETFRVEAGHPFLLDDHFRRLASGLAMLGIEWGITRAEAVEIIRELLAANELTNSYVRWNVSAGTGELGLYTGIYLKPTVIVYMKPVAPIQLITKEAVLLERRRNTPEGDFRLKSHHYLNNILAKRELGPVEHAEGIFLNESGYVAEGIVSNVFWIKGETVYTPATSTGILDGITRQYVLTVLEQEGISSEYGLYKEGELLEADAAFITNSIQEIVPLHRCHDKTFETDHPIIRKIRNAFERDRERLWTRRELVEENND